MDFWTLLVWLLLSSLSWWRKGIKTRWQWISVLAVHLKPPLLGISALVKLAHHLVGRRCAMLTDGFGSQQPRGYTWASTAFVEGSTPSQKCQWFSTESCWTSMQANVIDASAQSLINWVKVKLEFWDEFLSGLRSNFACPKAQKEKAIALTLPPVEGTVAHTDLVNEIKLLALPHGLLSIFFIFFLNLDNISVVRILWKPHVNTKILCDGDSIRVVAV